MRTVRCSGRREGGGGVSQHALGRDVCIPACTGHRGVISQGVSAKGSVCPGGVCPRGSALGGVCPGGVCPGSVCLGRCLPHTPSVPVGRMTDSCEKYYLAATMLRTVNMKSIGGLPLGPVSFQFHAVFRKNG